VEYKQCIQQLDACSDILENIPECVIRSTIDYISRRAEELSKEE